MKFLSLLLVVSLAPVAAWAQESARPLEGPPMTLGISPLRAELKIGAGVETTQSVRISNTGQVPTQIRVTVADWTLSPSGEQQFVRLGSGTWGCGTWLKANPMEFSLGPAAVELVRYTMKVPPAAVQGGYHCAILFDTLPPPREQLATGTGVVNLVRLVTTLYATIGEPPIVARIKRLEMTPRRTGKQASYQIVTEFANDGTTQYRVSGELELIDPQGHSIRKFEYKSFPVLPGVKREAMFQVDDPLAPGVYVLRAVIDVGAKERLGAETKVNLAGS
jgi:hypothetical protein